MLISNGHQEALHYPVGLLQFEAAMVKERINSELADKAVLFNLAIVDAIDGCFGKGKYKGFKDLINRF